MIYGTLYNAGRMLELTQKWETKKESGKVLAKQDRESLLPKNVNWKDFVRK